MGQQIHIPHIPKLFIVLKWAFLIVIAVATAVVGFAQAMLVASLYHMRSTFVINIVATNEAWVAKFFQWVGFNLALAFGASLSLFLISPAASGSGIPDVQAYLNGVESPVFKNFFTVKTFVAKVIGSSLAVGSSLVMGKEGPMLHAGSILAVILGSSKWFQQKMDVASHWGSYTYNRDIRDLVACGAVCGVCTAFKAPVGGVMFAMEMSTRWRKELTWRCFLVSALTIVVVRWSISTCVAHNHCTYLRWGSLAWFNQAYPAPYGQIWAFVLLAVVGGWVASVFAAFNTWLCLLRKKWSKWFSFRILEVCIISVITSVILFALPLAGRCHACDSGNKEHCVKNAAMFFTFPGYGCSDGEYNDLAVLAFNPQGFKIQALFAAPHKTFHISSLFIYSAFYYFLAAITYGAFIPSGLFTVSLIFGGCFGRIWAEVLLIMGAIDGSEPGIVGVYALLGAAAFLGGLMRMSASMCLILMEMTGDPTTLPFLMMVLIISKGVGDRFNYSVFHHQIMLKGFNFVGGLPEHLVKRAHLDAEDVMTKAVGGCVLHLQETYDYLMDTMDANKTTVAFPVVARCTSGEEQGDFKGIISRASVLELLAAHDKEQRKRAAAAAADTSTHSDWTIAAQAATPAAASTAAGTAEVVPADGAAPTATTSSAADSAGITAQNHNSDSTPQPEVAPSVSTSGSAATDLCSQQLIDLSSKVEVAPVVIPPGMPLTFIYHIMQEQGLNFVPVIRQHGPLEGMVTRSAIVAVQNERLDRFHVKESMHQVSQDIQGGRILQSMALEKQTAALKDAITAPLLKAKDLLVKDIREHDELLDEPDGRRPMIYLTPEDTATVVQHTSSSFGISTAGIRQAASSAPSAAAAAAALSQPGTAVVGGGVRGMYVGMSGVREQAGMRWSSGGESRANDEEDRALL